MPGISERTRRQVLDLHEQGLSQNAIAETLHIGHTTVSRALHGVSRPMGKPKRETDYREIRKRAEVAYHARMALQADGRLPPIDDMDEEDYRPRVTEVPD